MELRQGTLSSAVGVRLSARTKQLQKTDRPVGGRSELEGVSPPPAPPEVNSAGGEEALTRTPGWKSDSALLSCSTQRFHQALCWEKQPLVTNLTTKSLHFYSFCVLWLATNNSQGKRTSSFHLTSSMSQSHSLIDLRSHELVALTRFPQEHSLVA